MTEIVVRGGVAEQLDGSVRLVRRYCDAFLTQIGAFEDLGDLESFGRHLYSQARWRMGDFWFVQALGELRAGVGTQVAIIAGAYGLDVEDDLAAMLPAPE